MIAADSTAGHRAAFGCYLVFVIVIASVIPWQPESYFTGSFDLVAVAKATLALVGLLGALALAGTTRELLLVPVAPLLFVGAYLLSTILGALAAGYPAASAIIAVRLGIQLVTVTLLARRYPAPVLLPSLVVAIGTIAVMATITGIGNLASGRLAGGFPPMHPNELAFESAVVLTWVVAKIAQGRDTLGHLAVATVSLAVLLATGSRTTLVVMVPTILILIVTARAVRVRTGLLIGALVPLLVWSSVGTNAVADAISRGEDPSQLLTLSNRTIAWQAALAPKAGIWETIFGTGLATKQVPVAGQWWASQILDSSWVSALVQGGLLGLLICVLWILHSILRVTQTSLRDLLGWQLAMLMLLVGRGLLESGLFDATTAFLLLACVALANGTHIRRWKPGSLGTLPE